MGNWENNKICGKGKFDFANNCFYRGEFQDNHKHGKGIYTWANGNCYKVSIVACMFAVVIICILFSFAFVG